MLSRRYETLCRSYEWLHPGQWAAPPPAWDAVAAPRMPAVPRDARPWLLDRLGYHRSRVLAVPSSRPALNRVVLKVASSALAAVPVSVRTIPLICT